MIIQGNNNIDVISKHNTPLSAVYKGGLKIWPVTPPVIDGRVLFHKVFNSMDDLTATVGSSVGTWTLHDTAKGNAPGSTGIEIYPTSGQIPYYELANAVDIVYPLYIKVKGYLLSAIISGHGSILFISKDPPFEYPTQYTFTGFVVDYFNRNKWSIKFSETNSGGGYIDESAFSNADRGNQFTTDGSTVEILIEADGHITARIDGAVIINDQITHLEYLINKIKSIQLGSSRFYWDTANWVCQEMTVIDGYTGN
jgi:hypothetical protein